MSRLGLLDGRGVCRNCRKRPGVLRVGRGRSGTFTWLSCDECQETVDREMAKRAVLLLERKGRRA